MTAFQDLPSEVINVILGWVQDNKWLLRQASLTCHGLRAHAEILLYSNVVIKPEPIIDLMRFATTMQQNPRLANLVKSYSGPSDSFFSTLLEGDWVQTLVSVKKLHLIITNWKLPKIPSGLESLEIEGLYEPSEVGSLLMGMEDLRYLQFRNFHPRNRYPLSSLACPNLKVLNGSLKAAGAFLPGRNVVRFEWIYPRDEPVQLPDGLLQQLSPQFAHLRSLSYGPEDSSERIHPLYNLADHLHSLRFLEIQLMHPEDWLALPKLPQLRVLLVLEPSFILMSMIDEPDRIINLFTKCPHLERVDVGGRYYRITLTCRRWLRGAVEPLAVPLHVAERGRSEFIDDMDG